MIWYHWIAKTGSISYFDLFCFLHRSRDPSQRSYTYIFPLTTKTMLLHTSTNTQLFYIQSTRETYKSCYQLITSQRPYGTNRMLKTVMYGSFSVLILLFWDAFEISTIVNCVVREISVNYVTLSYLLLP